MLFVAHPCADGKYRLPAERELAPAVKLAVWIACITLSWLLAGGFVFGVYRLLQILSRVVL